MFRNGVNTEVYSMGSEVETGREGGLVGHRHVSMSHDSTQAFSPKLATMYSKRHNNPT
jgi:hypothetical protein